MVTTRNFPCNKIQMNTLEISLEHLLGQLEHTKKLKQLMEERRKISAKKEEAEEIVGVAGFKNLRNFRVDTSDGPAEFSRQERARHDNDRVDFRYADREGRQK
jgi:hypothetical protein